MTKYYYIRKIFYSFRKTISFFKLFMKTYDFDFSSLLEVEKKQLIYMRDCFLKDKFHYDIDIQRMNLAIKLIDLILNSEDSLVFDGSWKFDKYVNTKNESRFIPGMKYSECEESLAPVYLHSLYSIKVNRLYYKLRSQYTNSWWI